MNPHTGSSPILPSNQPTSMSIQPTTSPFVTLWYLIYHGLRIIICAEDAFPRHHKPPRLYLTYKTPIKRLYIARSSIPHPHVQFSEALIICCYNYHPSHLFYPSSYPHNVSSSLPEICPNYNTYRFVKSHSFSPNSLHIPIVSPIKSQFIILPKSAFVLSQTLTHHSNHSISYKEATSRGA